MSLLSRKHSKKTSPSGLADTRGVVAIEFALVAIPFFLVLFFIFELSLALFEQEALDSGLHLAARQIQTGNAQNVTNGAAFINSYLCPDTGNLLVCNNLYVNVEHFSPASNQDYYNFTTGNLPLSGNALDLSAYGSASFCNAGPAEFLLISAIYVAPSAIAGLLPGVLSVAYGNSQVHATLSQVAAFSEAYSPAAAAKNAARSC